MRPILRRLLPALVVLASLAGCSREREETGEAAAPAPPPATAPADAPAPLAFNRETSHAEVALALPAGVRSQPDLHAELYAAAVRDLQLFTEGAQADRTEAGGDVGLPAYSKTITFDSPVETGRLFSLAREDREFTGGAHGNSLYAAVIWDKAMKRRVPPAGLFRSGAALSPLDAALCAGVNREKQARQGAVPVRADGAEWSCPRAAATPFVLAPSTEAGKAGGLTFLIGPYQVGPYAEGGYEITVPQSLFQPLLAPAWADEFAGRPASAR